jgi:glucose-6-phosphate 1-epimerase
VARYYLEPANARIENARKMADFGDEEFMEMVCIEVGSVAAPVSLAGGQTWRGHQKLVASL